MNSQRQLLHDVSHEMRSPLARLQAAIGLARQRPDRVEAWLDRIERESERMDGMIGDVLALARLEGGVDQKLDDDINVDELVAQIADDAGFEAQAAGKTVRVDVQGAASVRGRSCRRAEPESGAASPIAACTWRRRPISWSKVVNRT